MSAARARAQRVLRCDCGQFLRLDRGLSAAVESASVGHESGASSVDDDDNDNEDEHTRLVSSLAEVRALSTPRSENPRASLSGQEEWATRASSSGTETSRPSSPPARHTPPPRRPSSPVPAAATAASDKPLWYVDLGGAETVLMTIEQVILARRSGKLGEGALVWRAGMSDWRPVGSLIPASSSPSHAPPAPLAAEPAQTLSYERPVPTLEFALERPASVPPPEREAHATITPTPSPARMARVRSSIPPPPRAPTPLPRPSASRHPHSQVGPLPLPAPLPTRRTPTPLPPAPPPVSVEANSVEATQSNSPEPMVTSIPLFQRASPSDTSEVNPLAGLQHTWPEARPRWVSVAIAVAVCVVASGSGAFVVRTLKLKREPLSLATKPLSAKTTLATTPVAPTAALPSPQAAPSTAVVDVESLSVEKAAPRARARARALPRTPSVIPTPKAAESSDSTEARSAELEAAPSEETSEPAAVVPSSAPAGEEPIKTPKGEEPGF